MNEPTRMVNCVKLGRELPGVSRRPFKDELGQRIYDNVSQQAWKLWLDQMTLLINEYRLTLTDPKAQKFLKEQCEAFLFGEGSARPPEFEPPSP